MVRSKRNLKGEREGKLSDGRGGNLFGTNAGVLLGVLAAGCDGVS